MKEITMLFLVLLISEVSISQDVPLEPFRMLKMSKRDSTSLISTWDKLLKAVKNDNKNVLDSLCLKKINCSICDSGKTEMYERKIVSVDEFISSFQEKYKEPFFLKMMEERKFKVIEATLYPEKTPENFKLGQHEKLVEYKIIFQRSNDATKYMEFYTFLFIKKRNQYKFSGLLID
jgi:hypothetical protein